MALRTVPTASPVSPVRYVIEGSASARPDLPGGDPGTQLRSELQVARLRRVHVDDIPSHADQVYPCWSWQVHQLMSAMADRAARARQI